jgi:hypothetical protein
MTRRTPSNRNHQFKMLAAVARQLAVSYPGPVLLVALVAGLLIGWVACGLIAPVVYVDIKPSRLSVQYQEVLIGYVADSYASRYASIEDIARRLGEGWTKQQVIDRIDQMIQARRPGADRLNVLKSGLITYPGEVGPSTTPRDTDGALGLIIGMLVAIVALGALIIRRIRSELVRPVADAAHGHAPHAPSTPPPATADAPPVGRAAGGTRLVDKPVWAGEDRQPLVQHVTSYVFGDDRYDTSFSIETGTGDLLGECGVGICEVVGTGAPDKVTALEVWLFDKNDIRTLTKVLMSDFCFGNSALQTKLAPKGEATHIHKGDLIELTTKSLGVTACITDLIYGEANVKVNLAANSYFQKVVIELTAWN